MRSADRVPAQFQYRGISLGAHDKGMDRTADEGMYEDMLVVDWVCRQHDRAPRFSFSRVPSVVS